MSNFPKAQGKSDEGLLKLIKEEGLEGGEVSMGAPKLNVKQFN